MLVFDRFFNKEPLGGDVFADATRVFELNYFNVMRMRTHFPHTWLCPDLRAQLVSGHREPTESDLRWAGRRGVAFLHCTLIFTGLAKISSWNVTFFVAPIRHTVKMMRGKGEGSGREAGEREHGSCCLFSAFWSIPSFLFFVTFDFVDLSLTTISVDCKRNFQPIGILASSALSCTVLIHQFSTKV